MVKPKARSTDEDTEAVDVRPCRNGATSGTNAAVQIVSSTQIATDPFIERTVNWKNPVLPGLRISLIHVAQHCVHPL